MTTKSKDIIAFLGETYPHAGCTLNFNNAYECLVAVMLSAQTNDNAVNAVRAYKPKIESDYHVKLSDDDIVKKRRTGRSFVDVVHNKRHNGDQAELAKTWDKEVNHGLKQVPIRITWGVRNFTGSDLSQLTPLERLGYPKNPYGF